MTGVWFPWQRKLARACAFAFLCSGRMQVWRQRRGPGGPSHSRSYSAVMMSIFPGKIASLLYIEHYIFFFNLWRALKHLFFLSSKLPSLSMSTSDHDVFPVFEATDALRVGIVIYSNVGTGNGLPDFKPLPFI